MAHQNVELAQRCSRCSSRPAKPSWDLMDEDIEVHDHDVMDAGEFRGHLGFARWLENWDAAWSEFTIEPEEFLDAGEHVVLVFRMKRPGAVAVLSSSARTQWCGRSATARPRVLTTTTTLSKPSTPSG